jgi:hypothetical protein
MSPKTSTRHLTLIAAMKAAMKKARIEDPGRVCEQSAFDQA